MTPENPRDHWWTWPAAWWRDQAFWRDVATRTTSGLLVVFVAWLFAVVFGYLAVPEILANVTNAIGVLAVAGMLGVIVLLFILGFRARREGLSMKPYFLLMLLPLAGILAITGDVISDLAHRYEW